MPSSATTTSATLPERLQSIPLMDLTRTFRDCITIARRIGVQFAWIDSLCIIQDSHSDWESEASQMASVYSSAYCTISASGSSNGEGGCHTDENSHAYGPVTLSWPITAETSETPPTLERVRIFSQFGIPLVNVLQTDPLHKRAWALQERELSPRILHYSADAIRWECRSLKASNHFPWEDSLAFNGAQRAFDAGQIPIHPLPSTSTSHPAPSSSPTKTQEEAWFTTVHNYTGRSLTQVSDTLPAISGIARAIHATTGDPYRAGLWQSNLLRCLLWASAWYDAAGLSSHTRPAHYLGPSWSWASVRGQVKYEWWIFNALHPAPAPRLVPSVLAAEITPAGTDPFGQLSGGSIRLAGLVKMAVTRGEGFARQDREGLYVVPKPGTGLTATTVAAAAAGERIGDIRFDVPSEAAAGVGVALFCLCVQVREERFGDSVGLALVLAPDGREGEGGSGWVFRRVGLIYMIRVGWWNDAVAMADVRIV